VTRCVSCLYGDLGAEHRGVYCTLLNRDIPIEEVVRAPDDCPLLENKQNG